MNKSEFVLKISISLKCNPVKKPILLISWSWEMFSDPVSTDTIKFLFSDIGLMIFAPILAVLLPSLKVLLFPFLSLNEWKNT